MYAVDDDFELDDLHVEELISTDEINVLIELNKIEEGKMLVIAALEKDPENIEYKEILIKILTRQNQFAIAERLAKNALKIYPNNRTIYGELIDIYIKQYKLDQAEELINTSLNNGIVDEFLMGQMITILYSKDKYEDALEFAERVTRSFPSNDNLKGQLINSLIANKDYNRAIMLVNNSINIYEFELKDILKAETISNDDMQCYDIKTVKKIKGYLLSMRQLININIKKKKYNVAAPMIESLSHKFPDSEVIKEQEISMLISQEKYEEAEKKALEILNKNPNNETVKSNLITIYTKSGQHYKANQRIHQDIDNPDTTLSTYKIRIGQAVTILVKGNKLEAAEELAKKGIEKIPYCRILKVKLVDILVRLRKYEEAINLNLQLIEEFPKSVDFRKKANVIQHRKENYELASETLIVEMSSKH